jgi:DNA-binding SARP family transcriptional activator/tetratricopeptide (TPR) repeat protein
VLRIRLLGGVHAEADGRSVPTPSSRRAWALLGWLALHPGMHSRADVAARLWPDVVDNSARQSMRSALWSLRAVLDDIAPHALITTRDRVGLADDVVVDIREFDRLLAAARPAEAVAAGAGTLLAGIDDEWAMVARDEHRERLGAALRVLSAGARADRDHGAAVEWSRRAVTLDPLSEDATRALMAALAAAGDRPAALAAYQRLAERLRRELRLAPSEPTWRLAERIRTQPAPAPAAVIDRPTRARPVALPLVGRTPEVAALRAAWDAASDGAGGFVTVHGEPGIGKSRLANEVAELAARGGAWVVAGAASDVPGPPLTPWIEVCGALARRLGELPAHPWVSALAPLLPARLPAETGTRPPDVAQARLFEGVVALLEECCDRAPVLLLLEDLHAADEASLALLAYVVRRAASQRLLVIATRRERPVRDRLSVLEQGQRQGGTMRADVALGPLEDDAVSHLARASGAPSDDAVARVVAVAEGNALLAVAAAHALSVGDSLPLGLRGAVRSAGARLPDDARLLVRTLAVAGRDLDPAEAATRAGVELASALPPAEDEGLLTYAGGRLRFRHALLRDAVYADIPAAERVERHARAAAELRTTGSHERAAEAAMHLRAAGRSRESGHLLLEAGAQARRVGALADATALLRDATEALPDDAAAGLELADVLAWRGRGVDARDAFERVLPLLEAAGDPAPLAAAHLRFAEWHYGPICRPRVAIAACRRALAILDGAGLAETDLRGRVLSVHAWCESIDGDAEDAERALGALAAVAGAEPADPVLACGTERARSFALLRQGRFADAVAPGIRAADAAMRAGRPDLAYTGLVNAAFGQAAGGDLPDALRLLDRTAEVVHGQGMLAIEALVLVDRAWVLVRLGRLAEAAEAAAQARRCADRLDAPDLQAVVDAERGRVALRAGDLEAAAELLDAALGVAGAAIGRPLARLQRAEALARLDRVTEAEAELAATVLEPMQPGDWPDTLVARAAAVQGLIAARRGQLDAARRLLTEAANGWRRRLSAPEVVRRITAVMVDLGRPIIGLVVPAEELAVVEADLAALPIPTEV